MKQFLITVAGVLVGMILFIVVVPFVIISMIVSSIGDRPPAPSSMVVAIDLREPMTDQRPLSPFASWGGHGQNLLDIVTKIDAAARDRRVKGLYVRAAAAGMAPAHAEEIRAALEAFREAGKFVVAHITSEDSRMSVAGYAAIAGSDQVWLQGVNGLMPMGLAAEGVFLGDTLRRYRMQAQFETREEYKSGPSVLTQTGFTPEHREETESLLNSIYAALVRGIAADRELTPEAVRAAMESTPVSGEQAVSLKLADQLGQPEEAARAALERAGEGAELVELSDYHPPRGSGRAAVIAVVSGEGEIINGPVESSPFSDSQMMVSDEITAAFEEASEDEDVRAIIFRVSSPGGSPAASDQILAALRAARAAGKKVVVSMGEVAASGGYYVSAEADEIVASQSTITGSIGVYGGKLVLGPMFEHYFSAHTEAISVGSPNVRMLNSDEPFTQAERAAYAGVIDGIYETFRARVAAGRNLTPDQVRQVARGRVWTGEQARARGLVDHIGGFATAITRARALAEIAENERTELRFFPAQRSPFEELQELFGASAESARAAAVLGALMGDERLSALIRAAREDDGFAHTRAETLTIR